MALTSVTVVDLEMSSGTAEGERSYTVTYQAISNDVNDGPLTVVLSPLLPSFRTSLAVGNDFDAGAFPNNYRARRDVTVSRLHWVITITFSTIGTKRNQEFVDDPVDQAPIISGGGRTFSKVVEFDSDSNPILNSAGDMIVDVEIDDVRPSLRIQKNFNTVDLAQFREFSNTTNSAQFFGLPANSWKLSHPRWEQKYRGNSTPYYTVTFDFEAASDVWAQWDRVLIDRGIYQVVNGKRTQCADDKGHKFSTPQNLDGSGAQAAVGDPPFELPALKLYERKDFAQLGIPTSL